jgi:hypothetical protein
VYIPIVVQIVVGNWGCADGGSCNAATFHICVAMKPLQGNFAHNAVEYGVAGLNIDDARVLAKSGFIKFGGAGQMRSEPNVLGRYPSNVILQDSDDIASNFPVKRGPENKNSSPRGDHHGVVFAAPKTGDRIDHLYDNKGGNVSRFFKKVVEFTG